MTEKYRTPTEKVPSCCAIYHNAKGGANNKKLSTNELRVKSNYGGISVFAGTLRTPTLELCYAQFKVFNPT